jgi:hypothetical protein
LYPVARHAVAIVLVVVVVVAPSSPIAIFVIVVISRHTTANRSVAVAIVVVTVVGRRRPPKHSSRGLSVQPIYFIINGAVYWKGIGTKTFTLEEQPTQRRIGERKLWGGREESSPSCEDEIFGVKEQRMGSI